MNYIVESQYDHITVREYVSRVVGLSRATLKHLKFLPDGITVNGQQVTVRYLLSEGDVLSLAFEDTEPQERLSCVDLPLSVVYEDSELVIPNKPADMPTHPSHGHYEDTVANALAFRYASEGIPFVFRPINRLDRNTSGLLMIARNRLSAATLSGAMKNGQIRKQYLAVLEGTPPCGEGVIDTYIRRTAESVIVRENCGEGEGGARAITRYRVLASCGSYSLCLASPETGRTHQLRVHFAGLGCSIVGDHLYGHTSSLIGRHALHAAALAFPHPTDGRHIRVCAPLHEDMMSLLRTVFSQEALAIAAAECEKEGIPLEKTEG